MLRTNLSTRPFYNDRAVRIGIAAGMLLVAALTTFNVARIVTLNRRNGELVARAEAAESHANALRQQAMQIRQTLDANDVAMLQAAASEANLLIERRAFSWTDLFNRFEETLPDDVRVAAVQPQVDTEGRMLVVATVYSKRIEDLDDFIEQLQQTRAFSGVLSRQDDLEEDGTLRSVIQGYYNPQG
ncbi:MAG: hypothetical protein ACRD1H_18600, partial [Vicinamibacterales bacterium]